MHGKLLAPYGKAIFLDMNHLDGTALHHGDLPGALLGLTRRDATDLSMFLAVHDRIMTGVSDADVRSRLLVALFCASLNKRDIFEALERRIGMDQIVRDNLDAYARRRQLAEDQEAVGRSLKAEWIRLLPRVAGVPVEVMDLIGSAPDALIPDLRDLVHRALDDHDWAPVLNFDLEDIKPGR